MNAVSAPIVGFIPPATTFTRQQTIQAGAIALDGDMTKNVDVKSSLFVAWKTWLANWTTFYLMYNDGTFGNFSARLGTLGNSEGVAAQTDEYGRTLNQFQATYASTTQKEPTLPVITTPPDAPSSSWPWWVYVGGTAIVGGLVWYIYKIAKYGSGQVEYVHRLKGAVEHEVGGYLPAPAGRVFAATHDRDPLAPRHVPAPLAVRHAPRQKAVHDCGFEHSADRDPGFPASGDPGVYMYPDEDE